MAVRYKPEVHDFIRTHLDQFTIQEMAEEVNRRFGTDFNYGKMKAYYNNHKYHTGKRAKYYTDAWPKEIHDFILENYKGTGYHQMIALIKEKFGKEYSFNQVKGFYGRNHLNSGLTGRFEPGHVPWTKGKKWSEYMSEEAQKNSRRTCFEHAHIPDNHLPVGSIRETKDGYLIKKVQERGYQWDRWKLLHRLVWEENFGPIPEGMIVGFRDLDKKNCSPDNLYLLTLGENAQMNKKGFRSQNPELTDVGLATVRLERAIRDRRKKKK